MISMKCASVSKKMTCENLRQRKRTKERNNSEIMCWNFVSSCWFLISNIHHKKAEHTKQIGRNKRNERISIENNFKMKNAK